MIDASRAGSSEHSTNGVSPDKLSPHRGAEGVSREELELQVDRHARANTSTRRRIRTLTLEAFLHTQTQMSDATNAHTCTHSLTRTHSLTHPRSLTGGEYGGESPRI